MWYTPREVDEAGLVGYFALARTDDCCLGFCFPRFLVHVRHDMMVSFNNKDYIQSVETLDDECRLFKVPAFEKGE